MKVLYVDDEPDLISVVTRALRLDRDIEVRAVGRAVDGLEILASGVWKPDVVLLDVMMPEMDGPTMLEHIAALPGPRLRVIFFTAQARDCEILQLAERGAIGILTKPFDPMTLAGDIRRLVQAAGAIESPET